MRCSHFTFLLTTLFIIVGQVRAQESVLDSARMDEEALKAAHLGTDGAKLLDFLRGRSLTDANRGKVKGMVSKLGDKSWRTREKASDDLVALGPLALPLLREATKDPDLEVARRASRCLESIEKGSSAALASAAVRQIARGKPMDAAQVLLDYLPAADDEYVADEVRLSLVALALRDGQPEMALVSAMTADDPIKRGAAGEALCRAGATTQLSAVRKLFQDSDRGVRLRVAMAMAEKKDRLAIPVLIDLLAEMPQEQGWQAESVLLRLADEKGPGISLGSNEAERKKSRDAWAGWWKENGDKIDLARLDGAPRLLGITLIATWDNGQVGTLLELGPDNKPHWQLASTPWPLEVQILPNRNLLLVEYYDNMITERTRKGELIWKHALSGALYAHRLPNGNTFMANRTQLLEVDRHGKEILSVTRNGMEAIQKLPGGRIACVMSDGNYALLDEKGKEVKSFNVGRIHSYGVFAVLPNGGVVIPQGDTNKVVEYDANGKKLWEAEVQKPTAVWRVPNGNTLVACRDVQQVMELDRKGKQVWVHKSAGFPWRVQRR